VKRPAYRRRGQGGGGGGTTKNQRPEGKDDIAVHGDAAKKLWSMLVATSWRGPERKAVPEGTKARGGGGRKRHFLQRRSLPSWWKENIVTSLFLFRLRQNTEENGTSIEKKKEKTPKKKGEGKRTIGKKFRGPQTPLPSKDQLLGERDHIAFSNSGDEQLAK